MSEKKESDENRVESILKNAEAMMATLNQLSETGKSAVSTSAEAQRASAATLAEAQAKLAEITAIATQALSAKTQITDDQAVIATKSDHIQKAQEHADQVRASLDRMVTAAMQQGTEVEGLKYKADSAAELLAEIRTAKSAVDKDAGSIKEARELAEQSTAQTKALADKADSVSNLPPEANFRLGRRLAKFRL